jgi:1-aminocyclopropane-1-carboxylate deaminase
MPEPSLLRSYSFPHLDIDILHLEKLHPITGGNKIFKLKHYLIKYAEENYAGIASMGGPRSNLLAALGTVCKEKNIPATFFIRGEEYNEKPFSLKKYFLNHPHISFEFLNRTRFRNLYFNGKKSSGLINLIEKNYLFIPMGADSDEGVKGASEIMALIPNEAKIIVCAVGSGATFKGLCLGKKNHQIVVGINCIKNNAYINEIPIRVSKEALENIPSLKQDLIVTGFEFGGPGKLNFELREWMNDIRHNFMIELDEVYNAKALFVTVNFLYRFFKNKKVIFIHTGGLWEKYAGLY